MERFDLAAFYGGSATALYETLGAHREGDGWVFRTWAPNARAVSVTGDWCGWNTTAHPMERHEGGIWETRVAHLSQYDCYKFAVTAPDGRVTLKADPYAFHAETRPGTASKLYELTPYDWQDGDYRAARKPVYDRALNIYEVHLGSWRRRENGDFYDYRSLADELSEYVTDLGYNCIELMPVTEYPLDDSWGYQCTGYFAPTSRYGTPHDFMYFVDTMHRHGIAVILDWVPAHFCKDEHGLIEFDGTSCYEYADPRKREHDGWGTRVFDYGRGEVKSFLLSSAAYWLREYHIDGLRVDAVASMLYLDYGRSAGNWTPNVNGGHENLEAIEFLRALNTTAFAIDPNVMMVAEESTAWPLVTYPVSDGGLGFNLKWNMGWMNDMCHYLKLDPWFRQYNHKDITFSLMYAFSENFVLPLSHDEVVYMKGSLRGKMPGDDWRQLASVRAFIVYMLTHPGKKLLFMGAELGQWHEWAFAGQLDWYLLENEANRQTQDFFRAANRYYLANPALWRIDCDWSGFEWMVADDNGNNVIVFVRRDGEGEELLVAVNFSPNGYRDYRFGVPPRREWREELSTDEPAFGGTGDWRNPKPIKTERIASHGCDQSVAITIPPLGAVILRGTGTLRKSAAKKPATKTTESSAATKKTIAKKAATAAKTAEPLATETKPAKKTAGKSAEKQAEKQVEKQAEKQVEKQVEKQAEKITTAKPTAEKRSTAKKPTTARAPKESKARKEKTT